MIKYCDRLSDSEEFCGEESVYFYRNDRFAFGRCKEHRFYEWKEMTRDEADVFLVHEE